MRIDKLLGNLGYGTRSEIKKFCRQGLVIVNGREFLKSSDHVNPDIDEIYFNGEKVEYREYIYLMLNKPDGYISATFDKYDPVVLDLIDERYLSFEPFPVGRLDKDTEGLLVLTNDGKLSHRVLSPKKHVPKKYYAIVRGIVNDESIERFLEGVYIGEDYTTKPSKLSILGEISLDEISEMKGISREEIECVLDSAGVEDRMFTQVEVVIYEGKFHQVKRMFNAIDCDVMYLKRVQMGGLALDDSLALGEYRELTDEEVLLLEEDCM